MLVDLLVKVKDIEINEKKGKIRQVNLTDLSEMAHFLKTKKIEEIKNLPIDVKRREELILAEFEKDDSDAYSELSTAKGMAFILKRVISSDENITDEDIESIIVTENIKEIQSYLFPSHTSGEDTDTSEKKKNL